MPNRFDVNIPDSAGNVCNVKLEIGEVLYVLGANGTGKSSLISRLASLYPHEAKRISAHRQTWFESNTIDLTPRNRVELGQTSKNQDSQPTSRYKEWNPAVRASMAIFDLIDADTTQSRKIADLVRSGQIPDAELEAQNPSPIQTLNTIMRLSNLPIHISVEEGQRIVARKMDGEPYSATELSDGERNAFLMAADVLTAKAGTLLLIDEPERHLHRSITSPLLKLLFDCRKDCAFVVSTHELLLSLDTPSAKTLLVRDCKYQRQSVVSWTVDLLEPGTQIDDELKSDLLGSRQKIIIVEGNTQSLDVPLYSLLFPDASVVSKGSCREVEQAVRGLRGADGIHWVSAFGIVDNDQRNAHDISNLKNVGIWALPHYSVESLYYSQKMISLVAIRQADLIDEDASTLCHNAIAEAISAANSQRDHLVSKSVLRTLRSKFFDSIPNKRDQTLQETIELKIEVLPLRRAEELEFDRLVSTSDFDGLLTRYPLRECAALDRIVTGLKFIDRITYQSAVLKLLQDDVAALSTMRELLGDLCAEVSGQSSIA
jgi:ABC-type cobalamin/Fe3+-siderophores transport system ATPase subunit